jgi:hypothetical protein
LIACLDYRTGDLTVADVTTGMAEEVGEVGEDLTAVRAEQVEATITIRAVAAGEVTLTTNTGDLEKDDIIIVLEEAGYTPEVVLRIAHQI